MGYLTIKINTETHPSREGKTSIDLPKNPLQIKIGTKNWRVSTTHNWKYRGGGEKSSVQLRSQILSPTKSSEKVGEEFDGTDPAKSTTNCADTLLEGKREKEDMD